MPRQIKNESEALLENNNDTATAYKDRLVKIIPSEIVAAYVAIYGMVQGVIVGDKSILLWIVIVLLVLLTPFYLVKVSGVTKKGQILCSTLGFLVWAFATGSPVEYILEFPAVFISSLVLIIYTLFIPVFYKG